MASTLCRKEYPMTQQEFLTAYWEMLEADSAKTKPSAMSRTFMDREAEAFAHHLWEFVTSKMCIEMDETWLTMALLKTRKFDSAQEQAAAIMALRSTGKP